MTWNPTQTLTAPVIIKDERSTENLFIELRSGEVIELELGFWTARDKAVAIFREQFFEHGKEIIPASEIVRIRVEEKTK